MKSKCVPGGASLTICAIVVNLLLAGSADAAYRTVGINLCDSATQLASGQVAGAPGAAQDNWNNVLSTASVGVFLDDDEGDPTDAAISAISNQFNSSAFGKNAVADAVEGTPNGKLYMSSLFRKSGTDGSVTVTGMGTTFPKYDMYVYYGFHGDLRWNTCDTSLGRIVVSDGGSMNVAREFQGPAVGGGSGPLYYGYNFDGSFSEWFDEGLLRAGGQKVGTYSTHMIFSDLTADTLTIAVGRASCFGGSDPRHGSGITALQFVQTVIPGDANLDGIVDGQDFTILKSNFGQDPATWGMGNFNDDDIVDGQDFTILKAHYGQGGSASAAAPEPTTLLLLCGGAVCLLKGRRRA